MLDKITKLFPVWAILFAVIAYLSPEIFTSLKSLIIPLLMLIMLSMGLTLTINDFANIKDKKSAIAVGVFLQFTIMPLVAIVISRALGLSNELTIGMILVGSVAGGTSSNVMCYLAKGDVALSISMTAISTMLAVLLTPLISSLLAGQSVDVPVIPMFLSLLKIVVLPIVVGVSLNTFFTKSVSKFHAVLPLFSMLSIVVIIAIVVALNAANIDKIGGMVVLAVILHNTLGLVLGYGLTRLLGFSPNVCRTIAFEVGLQNSGLAAALAMKFFSPASAIPGTVFSLWHNISGSVLAGYWAGKPLAIEEPLTQDDVIGRGNGLNVN